jgi:hypothetical protein
MISWRSKSQPLQSLEAVTIRPRKNRSGSVVYILDLGDGKGNRRTFKTKAKAQEELRKAERFP